MSRLKVVILVSIMTIGVLLVAGLGCSTDTTRHTPEEWTPKELANYTDITVYDSWKEALGDQAPASSQFSQLQESWGNIRKQQMLAIYPISQKGKELLDKTAMLRLPYTPTTLSGGNKASAYAIGEQRIIVTSSVHPTQTLHEFSHVAFYQMVARGNSDEKIKKHNELVRDLEEFFLNPPKDFLHISLCLIPLEIRMEGELRDASFSFYEDPEHMLISIIELAGGNLSLIPPNLRKYTPWLAPAEPGSWEEVQLMYSSLNVESRIIYDGLRLHNPFFCLGDVNDTLTTGGLDIRLHPAYNDAASVLRSAYGEFLTDVFENGLWKKDARNSGLARALRTFPDLFYYAMQFETLEKYARIFRTYEFLAKEVLRSPMLVDTDYILNNFSEWAEKRRAISYAQGYGWDFRSPFESPTEEQGLDMLLTIPFVNFLEAEFPEIFTFPLYCTQVSDRQQYEKCNKSSEKSRSFMLKLRDYIETGVTADNWTHAEKIRFVKIFSEIKKEIRAMHRPEKYLVEKDGQWTVIYAAPALTRSGQSTWLILAFETDNSNQNIANAEFRIIPPGEDLYGFARSDFLALREE